jgi:hypothetical protein
MPQHCSQAGVPYVITLATGWVPQAASGEAFGLLCHFFRTVAVCFAVRLAGFVMQAVMQTDFGRRNADNILDIQAQQSSSSRNSSSSNISNSSTTNIGI